VTVRISPSFECAALLKLGYACNNHCSFCHVGRGRGDKPALATREILHRMELAVRKGCDGVVFSGGEPAIRDDLEMLVHAASEMDLIPGIVTNARMFSYVKLAERLVEKGLDYALVSLHSAVPEEHDGLVDVHGAFEQTLAGTRNLHDTGIGWLVVNTVITSVNVKRLSGIVELVASMPRAGLKLSLMEPKGFALENLAELMPDPKETASEVLAAVALADRLGVQVGYDGFPACIPGAFDLLDQNLESHSIRFMMETFEQELQAVDRGARFYAPGKCYDCAWKERCPGLYEGYRGTIWESALRPLRGAGPNSIALWPGRELGCEHADSIEVKLPNNSFRVPMCSMDFDEDLLNEVVKSGQVYFMQDPGCDRIDDALVQLEETGGSPGLSFRVSESKPFDLEKTWLKQLVANIRGKVLDIGAGFPCYMEQVRNSVERHDMEYWAVDPGDDAVSDPVDLPRGARYLKTRFEEADLPGRYFDAVLALRCLDHMQDPLGALIMISRLIKPGGLLVISEDSPFMVITENMPPEGKRFEHYHNLSITEILPITTLLGFELKEKREPGPGSSPSFTLVFGKTRS